MAKFIGLWVDLEEIAPNDDRKQWLIINTDEIASVCAYHQGDSLIWEEAFLRTTDGREYALDGDAYEKVYNALNAVDA